MPKRNVVSLLTALSFVVLSATGILAFIRPFSIQIVGLHALLGFVFIGLIALHVFNNQGPLKRYLKSRTLWTTLAIVSALTALFAWQPAPVRAVLGLSKNLGPALDSFEVTSDGLDYAYTPSPNYKMQLRVRAGDAFDFEKPPQVAIWLENASHYHIKTLRRPEQGAAEAAETLPYWEFKVRGWEEAKQKSEASVETLGEQADVVGISGATKNSSFDPADYILPADPDNPDNAMPYRLLIEIEQPDDGQASLVYAVDIDNADPVVFQLLELVGYPKREDAEDGKEEWALYYIDETFGSALELIDSALLTIER